MPQTVYTKQEVDDLIGAIPAGPAGPAGPQGPPGPAPDLTAYATEVALAALTARIAVLEAQAGALPPPSPDPTPASGLFTVNNGTIYDPSGSEFVPIGANLGLRGSFDWKGVANGHSADALAWGWNFIRLNAGALEGLSTYGAIPSSWATATGIADWHNSTQYATNLANIDAIVQEYTAKGIVVCIASHDLRTLSGNSTWPPSVLIPMVKQFMHDLAVKYKDNPYVWLEPHNEPPLVDDAYLAEMRSQLTSIRAAGFNGPIVVCAESVGTEANGNTPLDVAVPQLADVAGPLVGAVHAYGFGTSTSATAFDAYVTRCRNAGVALMVGEFGWTIDGSSTAGGYTQNRAGGLAVLTVAPNRKVGLCVWHGTMGDKYSLKSNGNAFYDGGAGAGLSDLGTRFWALTH